jgi:hypothetical protein
MFVKVYIYHIQEDKIEEYLNIQEKAGKVYGKYIDSQTTYLRSNVDATKWMEITKYKSEEEYNKNIDLIHHHKEIKELYHSFQAELVKGKDEIVEENFTEIFNVIN